MFLRNWPYVYGQAATPGDGSVVAGKFGVTALPGLKGPGSSVLGGANLAISSYSRHQRTALDFIEFLTGLPSERLVLVNGSLPPVWTSLYTDRALIRRFPYLPALKKAILFARPRPQTPSYSQFSLTISSTIHEALVRDLDVSSLFHLLLHAGLSRRYPVIMSGPVIMERGCRISRSRFRGCAASRDHGTVPSLGTPWRVLIVSRRGCSGRRAVTFVSWRY